MKSINFNIRTLIVMLSVTIACQPEDDFPALSNPLPLKTELLEGTWTVSKVIQVDKEAVDNGFPLEVQQRDITGLFPFTDYTITFNLDPTGRPGTFQVEAGASPNFLTLNDGIWAINDYVFATTITLTNPADVNASAFRIKQLEENLIRIQVVRNDLVDNTEYSYYEYEFVK